MGNEALYTAYANIDTDEFSEEAEEWGIAEYAYVHKLSTDTVRNAVDVANKYAVYSSWYKELYGYLPKNAFDK